MAKYDDFITTNIANEGARRIGIYDVNGNRVGQIPLGPLAVSASETGKKLYTFGALSDVHVGQTTANEDFAKALDYMSEKTDFICICGDLVNADDDTQRADYKAIVEQHATVPVYATSGNHDGYNANIETLIESYTGFPLYFTINRSNDVHIFVGLRSSTHGQIFTTAELQWLYETLEANRNKRCFVWMHARPLDACGNALGIYKHDILSDTEKVVFESMLSHYKNVIHFHGHSHLKFDLQQYSALANVDNIFGCWTVHIPSISVPRGPVSEVDTTRVELYAESEGYIVDVYENGIHLQGRDFIKDKFLPIASYWLDTKLQTVPAGAYDDPSGTIQT